MRGALGALGALRQNEIVSESPWVRPDTVRGFVQSPPNHTLMRFAAAERARCGALPRAVDIGCGAARNAVPLAEAGWHVWGLDDSWPMLEAAAGRLRSTSAGGLHVLQGRMTHLPFPDRTFDLAIAHGVWNLATSDHAFRTAVHEAARVVRPGGALFVFTFSRHTLPADALPLAGESYVYDRFSGSPQIFLTADQLIAELAVAGFAADAAVPLTEHNRQARRMLASGGPVIYEGAFRRTA